MRFIYFLLNLPITAAKVAVCLSPYYFMWTDPSKDIAVWAMHLGVSFFWLPVLVYFMFLRTMKPRLMPINADYVSVGQQDHPYVQRNMMKPDDDLFYIPGNIDGDGYYSAKSLHDM